MIFPRDVGLFRWASEGLFGVLKRRRERQLPLYRQASRFIEAFETHGVARQQVPRLMPEPIRLSLQAVATPEALAAKLGLEHLDWASETLALQREWFDAEGGQPHQVVHEVYKMPGSPHHWLQSRLSIRPGYHAALHLATQAEFLDPGQAEGSFFVAYEECFSEVGDKPISRYWYLSDGSRFDHTPCTVDLISLLTIAESLGVSSIGHVLPSRVIGRAESGTLGLLPKVLNQGRRWQPREWVPSGYEASNCESDVHRQLWSEVHQKIVASGLQRLLILPSQGSASSRAA